MPQLVAPTEDVRMSYLAAVAGFQAEGRHTEVDVEALRDQTAFHRYVAGLVADAQPDTPRPDGYVPSTVLWWIDGVEFLGRLSIRHRLTDALTRIGGHIGYEVAPSVRRRGHATAMLAAALPVAARLGIDPALVTCDAGNVASRLVIERNGGRPIEPYGDTLRFWVPTRHG
jgi:predicted acetyltransferase